MARMAGEQATHWFWEAQWPRNVVWEFEWLRKVVLGIQGARFDNSSGLEQSFSAFQSHGKLVLGSPESQKRGFGNSSGSGRQAEAGRQAGRQRQAQRKAGRQVGRQIGRHACMQAGRQAGRLSCVLTQLRLARSHARHETNTRPRPGQDPAKTQPRPGPRISPPRPRPGQIHGPDLGRVLAGSSSLEFPNHVSGPLSFPKPVCRLLPRHACHADPCFFNSN